jgi:hypothetical protein
LVAGRVSCALWNMSTKNDDAPSSPTGPGAPSTDPAIEGPPNAVFGPAPPRPVEEAEDATTVRIGEHMGRRVSVPQLPRGTIVASMALACVLALAFAAGRLTSGSQEAPGQPAAGHHTHPTRAGRHPGRPRSSSPRATRRPHAPARSPHHHASTVRSAVARSRPREVPAPPAPASAPESVAPTQAQATPPSGSREEDQTPGGLFSP